jgi:dimethylaniline monooxygenase (N-oxide forming)
MDLVSDFYGYAQVLTPKLKNLLAAKGSVHAVKGEIARLRSNEVELKDGSVLPCDLLVCATGFQKDYSMFPGNERENLGVEHDGLYLYKHTIPPDVPDLAFCGSEVATISNIVTFGLQAEWICGVIEGQVQLPGAETMRAQVEEHRAWARAWMPSTPSRASLVLLHQIHFHDGLLKDLGLQHLRKPNALAELFMPYEPADYDGVVKNHAAK